MPQQTLVQRPAAVAVRPARPHDAAAVQAFVQALPPASRRLRFHGALNACSPALLRHLTEPDGQRHWAFVACAPVPGGEAVVGQASAVRAADTARVEFALVVADGQRGSGLAGRLLGALADAVRGAGVRELVGEVLEDNTRMQAFLQREGFVPDGAGHDDGVSRWTRRLAPPPVALPSRDFGAAAARLLARFAPRRASVWSAPARRPA
jgi:GNAT superfamily N-acetyltransferase